MLSFCNCIRLLLKRNPFKEHTLVTANYLLVRIVESRRKLHIRVRDCRIG